MILQRSLLYGLIAILVVAPLPFGSVQRGASLRLCAACLLLGVVWVAWRTRSGLSPLPWRDPALAGGALIALFAVAQIVPLPEPVLEKISPKAVSLRAAYEPPSPPTDRGYRPVSLDPAATRLSLLKWLAYLVVALITIDLAGRRAARVPIATGLMLGGGVQAVYGLVEYLSGRHHIFGYAKKYYTDVATGTFINRNHYAGYIEMTLPLAVAALATALVRLRSRPGTSLGERLANASGRDLFTVALFLLLSLVMATALACSRSRMGIASAGLALAATAVTLTWKGRGRGFAAAAVAIAGALGVLFMQTGAGGPILDRFTVVLAEFQGQMGRWEIWKQVFRMATSFPLAGVGLGAFESAFAVFRTSGPGVAFDHAHNDYLELAAEVGLYGIVLMVAAMMFAMKPLLIHRSARIDFGPFGYATATGVMAIVLHSLTDFNLAIPANALTLASILGITMSWRRAPVPVLASGATPRHVRAAWVWAPVVSLIAVGLVLATEAVDPNEMFRSAVRIERDAMIDLQVLFDASDTTHRPSSVAVDYIAHRLDAAEELQLASLRMLPIAAAGHLGLARIQLERCGVLSLTGDAANDCGVRTLRELKVAVSLAPMSAVVHAQAALILLTMRPLLDADEAAEAQMVVDRAASMNPGDRDLVGARLIPTQPPGS